MQRPTKQPKKLQSQRKQLKSKVPATEISVYAITKNGRRYEDINYISRESASKKIEQMLSSMKKAQSHSTNQNFVKFDIVETQKPNKVW